MPPDRTQMQHWRGNARSMQHRWAAVAEAIKAKEQEQLEAVEAALAAQAENHASGLDAARSDTEQHWRGNARSMQHR